MRILSTCPRKYSSSNFLATVFPSVGVLGLGQIAVSIGFLTPSMLIPLNTIAQASISQNNISNLTSYTMISLLFYVNHSINTSETAFDLITTGGINFSTFTNTSSTSTIINQDTLYTLNIYIVKIGSSSYVFLIPPGSGLSNLSSITITGETSQIDIIIKNSSSITSGNNYLKYLRLVKIEIYSDNMVSNHNYGTNCWPGCFSCSEPTTCLNNTYSLITNKNNSNLDYLNIAVVNTANNNGIEEELLSISSIPPAKANGYTLGLWVYALELQSNTSYVTIAADEVIKLTLQNALVNSTTKLDINPSVLGVKYSSSLKTSELNGFGRWIHIKIGYIEERQFTNPSNSGSINNGFIEVALSPEVIVTNEFSTDWILTTDPSTSEQIKIEKPYIKIWGSTFNFKIIRKVSNIASDFDEVFIREIVFFDTYVRTPFQNL